MPGPTSPYRPYQDVHISTKGPGDARPTAIQILKDCDKIGKLKGRTVLVTGCSAGIGVETARALYEAGATLYLTARDIPKLEAMINDIVAKAEFNKTGPRPQALEMHLDDFASVRAGAAQFQAKSGGELNYLILNAGVMTSKFNQTKDGYEQSIGVNHFAHFLLFQLLKPQLIASAMKTASTSRVVLLSSAAHRQTPVVFSNKDELDTWNAGQDYDMWLSYGSSKTANIWTANAISRHYASRNVIGLSVHPGAILETSFSRHMSEEYLKSFDWDKLRSIDKSAAQGAATTVWATVTDHYEGKHGGVYLADAGEAVAWQGESATGAPQYWPHAYDEEKEENLWNLSCDALGLPRDG